MPSNYLYKFDRFIGRLIPSFNVRAILYLSLIFAFAMYIEIWRISTPQGEVNRAATQMTIDRAAGYWNNSGYESGPPKQQTYEQSY